MVLAIQKLSAYCQEQGICYSTPEQDPSILNSCNQCTYGEHLSSSIAIFPETVEQIQKLVKLCGTLKEEHQALSIYTISQGKNWGYGSKTPTVDGSILLSLQNLRSEISWVGNRFDKPHRPYGKQLGIVKLGASITQQNLYEFLQQEGGQFWMDATGAPTDSSVVGNYLERGFGHTSYGDHFDHVVGMEVILADGTLVKTGHAGCNNAANIGIHKHGLGPITEGLFSQSCLGIVTAIYLELMPARKCLSKFFIQLNSNEDFYQAIERLQPLKAKEILSSQMHCGNTHKGIQAVMRYPFKETGGQTPLPDRLLQRLSRDLQLSPWTISGAIYGESWQEVRAKKRQLKQALRGLNCKKIILPEWLAIVAHKLFASSLLKTLFPQTQHKLFTQLTILKELIGLKKGIPTNYFMDSVYWRKRELPQSIDKLNPDRDRVGMVWIAPIAPMTPSCVKQLVDISTSTSEEFGFEPAISITLLNSRAADCILSIIWDREIAEEEAKALACYDKLMAQFNELGFTSYRASTRAMLNDQLNYSTELTQLHSKLREALDPSGLLATAHYLKTQTDNQMSN